MRCISRRTRALALLLAHIAVLYSPLPTSAALDVPAMLFNRRDADKNSPLTLLPADPLPKSLQARLATSSAAGKRAADFARLSAPLQRALLWDAGLIATSDGSQYVQLKTKCGKTMGDIFVSKDTIVRVANCSLAICNAQILAFAYPNCSADAVAPQTRCAVSANDPALASVRVNPTSSLWSEEGAVEDAYNFRLFIYDTSSSTSNRSSATTLFTLYQLPSFALQNEQTCPNKATAFVVPCQSIAGPSTSSSSPPAPTASSADNKTETDERDNVSEWCDPQAGVLVSLWLANELETPLNEANARTWMQIATVFIALFALATLVGISFAIRSWWTTRQQRKAASTTRTSSLSPHLHATTAPHYAVLSTTNASAAAPVVAGARRSRGRSAGSDRDAASRVTTPPPIKPTSAAPAAASTTSSSQSPAAIERLNAELLSKSLEIAAFVVDPDITCRTIPSTALFYESLVAKGANGEVWRGQFHENVVAIKRLLPDMRRDVRALELFAREVRLGASLEHPHIVQFVGVAWTSVADMSMVSEFLPMGDLARFLLSPNAQMLTWQREKLSIATDIAQALMYLHSLVPVIIHRDLKSLNVLLTATFVAKLSDFGLSRERSFDETMTMGVGTLLWTAPEVLRGDRYDEKSDIYSFGVVLSELDTCLPPYALNDEIGGGRNGGGHGREGIADRRRLRTKSVELLPLIRNGKITPQFRNDCPPAVHALALKCLASDPDKRPSAMQLVYMLQSKVSQSL